MSRLRLARSNGRRGGRRPIVSRSAEASNGRIGTDCYPQAPSGTPKFTKPHFKGTFYGLTMRVHASEHLGWSGS